MDKASSRPVRNRRHNSRHAWTTAEHQHHEHRMQKRLFTPEIKRMLKDWLVRRRENPYPSRDEKKCLAINTGLTYIQICNWFANWRRKLKNAGREPVKKTWGYLIKSYNTSTTGNVEQFSICSGDSIWGDEERSPFGACSSNPNQTTVFADHQRLMLQPWNESMHCDAAFSHITNAFSVPKYYDRFGVPNNGDRLMAGPQNAPSGSSYNTVRGPTEPLMEQCFQISSTTQSEHVCQTDKNSSITMMASKSPQTGGQLFSSKAKYKNNIMEKYLRDCTPLVENTIILPTETSSANYYSTSCRSSCHLERPLSDAEPIPAIMGGMELSKWVESAANFTPHKNNYIEWETATRNKANQNNKETTTQSDNQHLLTMLNHEREDLEAAEVLTSLAGNYRHRMMYGSGHAVMLDQP